MFPDQHSLQNTFTYDDVFFKIFNKYVHIFFRNDDTKSFMKCAIARFMDRKQISRSKISTIFDSNLIRFVNIK